MTIGVKAKIRSHIFDSSRRGLFYVVTSNLTFVFVHVYDFITKRYTTIQCVEIVKCRKVMNCEHYFERNQSREIAFRNLLKTFYRIGSVCDIKHRTSQRVQENICAMNQIVNEYSELSITRS